MPDDLVPQVPKLKEVLRALRIASAEYPRYEADDVLATLAARAAARGLRTIIVTTDKDLLQVVDRTTSVWNPSKETTVDEAGVEAFVRRRGRPGRRRPRPLGRPLGQRPGRARHRREDGQVPHQGVRLARRPPRPARPGQEPPGPGEDRAEPGGPRPQPAPGHRVPRPRRRARPRPLRRPGAGRAGDRTPVRRARVLLPPPGFPAEAPRRRPGRISRSSARRPASGPWPPGSPRPAKSRWTPRPTAPLRPGLASSGCLSRSSPARLFTSRSGTITWGPRPRSPRSAPCRSSSPSSKIRRSSKRDRTSSTT